MQTVLCGKQFLHRWGCCAAHQIISKKQIYEIDSAAPDNSFNRSANSAALIHKIGCLMRCVRARLIQVLGFRFTIKIIKTMS